MHLGLVNTCACYANTEFLSHCCRLLRMLEVLKSLAIEHTNIDIQKLVNQPILQPGRAGRKSLKDLNACLMLALRTSRLEDKRQLICDGVEGNLRHRCDELQERIGTLDKEATRTLKAKDGSYCPLSHAFYLTVAG